MFPAYKNLFKRVPKNIRRLTLILASIVVILVALMVVLLVELQAYRAPAQSAEDKVRKIVDEIGKTIILPPNELPTVATVADPGKLRDQPFFTNAEVGDEVLIYTASKKAVLWRPSIGKIVEVSSLNISIPQTTATTSARK